MRHVLFVAYVVVCLAALTWPGYAWLGAKVEPTVFGLPFFFAWNVAWVLLTFGVLVVYHVANGRAEA